jgi:hypothetical protein
MNEPTHTAIIIIPTIVVPISNIVLNEFEWGPARDEAGTNPLAANPAGI